MEMGSGVDEQSSREFVEGRLLDGFLLLAAGGSSAPEDVVHVNLASLQVVDVATEDLAYFVNLDRLDLSDNQLSYEQALEQFSPLPRLTTLLLACNSIPSLSLQPGVCQTLHTLDLSYNELHGDVLGQLANLPRLQILNLASNCISSFPPEEDIAGLQFLEELCLDANDLVQFLQWRQLDALPRLRKLSLASNRIKRLKDDAPEEQHGGGHYFPYLEELDLSSNEITSLESLPVLKMIPSLTVLNLTGNPCASMEPLPGKGMITAKIELGKTEAWYLQQKGCHQRQKKPHQPRIRMGKQKLRKVKDDRPMTMKKGLMQLAVFDPATGQLSMDINMTAGSGSPQDAPADQMLLTDELSEEEFDQILQNRRKKIDMAFSAAPVEEPTSFMRPVPFEISAEAGQRWRKLNSVEEAGPSTTARTGSGTFMTGVTDESAGGDGGRAGSAVGSGQQPPRRPQFLPRNGSPPVVLPPIRTDGVAASRASTAGEPARSRSESLGAITREGGKPRPLVDDGVREAMRALRAAALAEVAVAAA